MPTATLKNWERGKNAPPADELLKLHEKGLDATFILFGDARGEVACEGEGEYGRFLLSDEGKKLIRIWLRMPEAVRVGKLYELEAVATLLERAREEHSPPGNQSRAEGE